MTFQPWYVQGYAAVVCLPVYIYVCVCVNKSNTGIHIPIETVTLTEKEKQVFGLIVNAARVVMINSRSCSLELLNGCLEMGQKAVAQN